MSSHVGKPSLITGNLKANFHLNKLNVTLYTHTSTWSEKVIGLALKFESRTELFLALLPVWINEKFLTYKFQYKKR